MTESQNSHISKELLEKYHANKLKEEESYVMLEHIASCNLCSDVFAGSFIAKENLRQAPINLTERILMHSHTAISQTTMYRNNTEAVTSTQVISTKSGFPKKRFFIYCTKVCLTMCSALLVLFMPIMMDGNEGSVPFTEVREQGFDQQTGDKELIQGEKKSVSDLLGIMNGFLSQKTEVISERMNAIVIPSTANKN